MLNHQERYDNWAFTYNKDVEARGYKGPKYMATFLMDVIATQKTKVSPANPDIKVLDVGCGTGLAGAALKENGFSHIDGLDHSQGMIGEAYKTGIYQTLVGWINLQNPLPFFLHNQYDLTICCGVFALDFVKPTSLKWLIQVTKPNGLIVMTTKTTYYNEYDFEGYYKKLEQLGHLKLIDCKMDKPYLGTEADGHYWAFAVPPIKKELPADD